MTPQDWEAFLGARLQRPFTVRYGKARTMPVRVEGDTVRLHGFFAEADESIADALARWIAVGRRARKACALLDAWIDARLAELPKPEVRAVSLQPIGRVHDLGPMARALFASEFVADFAAEPERPGITWGRREKSKARRSIQLGSYQKARHLVRIHPVLDQPFVPAWFVRYVLFHEILHAAMPDEHHGPRFRARERVYPEFERAVRWQHKHINRLIRSARSGTLPNLPPPVRHQGLLFDNT